MLIFEKKICHFYGNSNYSRLHSYRFVTFRDPKIGKEMKMRTLPFELTVKFEDQHFKKMETCQFICFGDGEGGCNWIFLSEMKAKTLKNWCLNQQNVKFPIPFFWTYFIMKPFVKPNSILRNLGVSIWNTFYWFLAIFLKNLRLSTKFCKICDFLKKILKFWKMNLNFSKI